MNERLNLAGRPNRHTDLGAAMAMAAIAGEVRLPRMLRLGRVANHTDRLTRRQRAAATAKRAKALDGRVFQHRITGQIRAAHWRSDGVEFLEPKSGTVMLRKHHKALTWCSNADCITPTGAAAGGES